VEETCACKYTEADGTESTANDRMGATKEKAIEDTLNETKAIKYGNRAI
jgi:hypothetical protein